MFGGARGRAAEGRLACQGDESSLVVVGLERRVATDDYPVKYFDDHLYSLLVQGKCIPGRNVLLIFNSSPAR